MKKTSNSEKLFLDELTKSANELKVSSRGLSIGEIIIIIRKQLGMSQATLARRAKVPQSTISRIERAKKYNLSTLHKVLKALSCEIVLVPLLMEPIEKIRRRQARRLAEAKMLYLRGTMSLEKQEPDKKLLDALLQEEEDELLRSSGNKLWKNK